jgi:hypothetical protein
MAYVPAPSSGSDIPAQSRDTIYQNFLAIQTAFNLNHGDFNGAIEGKHKFLSMPEQAAAGPATAADELALYTKEFDNGVSVQTALFWRPENTASGGAEINITGGLNTAAGWARLPSGLLIKWGKTTITIGTPKTIVFPVAATIPVFTAPPFHIQLTGDRVDAFTFPLLAVNTSAGAITATGFPAIAARTSGSTGSLNTQFYYWAIGI